MVDRGTVDFLLNYEVWFASFSVVVTVVLKLLTLVLVFAAHGSVCLPAPYLALSICDADYD